MTVADIKATEAASKEASLTPHEAASKEASLTPHEVDALREVANVGCGHAATALSRLVGGRRVSIDVPRVFFRTAAELPDLLSAQQAEVVAASLDMEGDLRGRVLWVLTQADAARLCEAMIGKPGQPSGRFGEAQKSALAEAANIVASACLSAMGALTGFRLVPSIPVVHQNGAAQVLARTVPRSADGREVLGLEARFVALLEPPVSGQLFVLPEPPSVKVLLHRLGV